MKSKERLFAFIMAVVTVVSANACSTNNKTQKGKREETSDLNIQPVSDHILNSENLEENIIVNNGEEIIIDINSLNSGLNEPEDVLSMMHKSLYDESMDYNLVIDNYLQMDYSLRNNINNDYLRALYVYLLNTDISMELYAVELQNLFLLQQVPTDLDEETWHQLFGNLTKISNEKETSVYEMFFEISKYMHELECKKQHYINEYFGYSCESIEESKLVREK